MLAARARILRSEKFRPSVYLSSCPGEITWLPPSDPWLRQCGCVALVLGEEEEEERTLLLVALGMNDGYRCCQCSCRCYCCSRCPGAVLGQVKAEVASFRERDVTALRVEMAKDQRRQVEAMRRELQVVNIYRRVGGTVTFSRPPRDMLCLRNPQMRA